MSSAVALHTPLKLGVTDTSAIEQKFDHAKISCVPKTYLKKEKIEDLNVSAGILNVLEPALSPR